jgi:hypothetical protein
MHHSSERHNHILIQIGYGFLGILERFFVQECDRVRQYDFQRPLDKERDQELIAERNAGTIRGVNLPAKIFGPAKWAGLNRGQQDILDAVAQEVSRHPNSRRPDNAFVLHGNLVTGVGPKGQVACPLLSPDRDYIGFNGNGKRPGRGYRIVGRDGTGWLRKCGYEVPSQEADLMRSVRAFLGDLTRVAAILDLIVVGVRKGADGWLSLDNLIEIARGRGSLAELDPLIMRIYGPADYLERSRRYFERQGGFDVIPGTVDVGGRATEPEDSLSLAVRMRRAGIRQEDLAVHLNTDRTFLNKVLNGRKSWPQGMQEQAVDYLRQREEQVGRA